MGKAALSGMAQAVAAGGADRLAPAGVLVVGGYAADTKGRCECAAKQAG